MLRSLGFLINGVGSCKILYMFRALNILEKSPITKLYIQVIWLPTPRSWYKVNFDRSAKGSLGNASCGGIFCNYRGFARGCFIEPLGIQYPLFAEIMAFLLFVEIVCVKG